MGHGVTQDDILEHDEKNRALAGLLAVLEPPEFPVALGVIYCDPAPTYGEGVRRQTDAHQPPKLNDLLRSGRTWTVLG